MHMYLQLIIHRNYIVTSSVSNPVCIAYNTVGHGWSIVGVEWKTDSQIERLNFIEKLYFNITDLFCRYKIK